MKTMKTTVYTVCYDTDNGLFAEVYPSREEAEKAAMDWIFGMDVWQHCKEAYEADTGKSVDEQDFDEVSDVFAEYSYEGDTFAIDSHFLEVREEPE